MANQLNRGAELIDFGRERFQVAELNLVAGTKGQGLDGLCVSACRISTAGVALLDENDWSASTSLTFHLGLERAECELLTGELDIAATDRWKCFNAPVETVE